MPPIMPKIRGCPSMMGAPTPALVAVGYNRPAALRRLLESLRSIVLPGGTPLVISLDWSGNVEVARLADAFHWPHGPKRIIRHEQNLGLRRHILACGDLTAEYGAVALLEDDLLAAPGLYPYLVDAIAAYGNDDRIGGFSLYNYKINEFNNIDFCPIEDGSDVYFLQVAASWGQAWTLPQWTAFRDWYAVHKNELFLESDGIPRQLAGWRDNSWKRYFIKYLATTGRYFVYPRASLTTNCADPGTNTRRSVSIYQTPLDAGVRDWRLVPLDHSLARYDVFYEPEPQVLKRLAPVLDDGGGDFDVDLFGTKPVAALTRPRLLSSRPCSTGAGFALRGGGPPVASILNSRPGTFFHLSDRDSFGRMTITRKHALIRACQIGNPLNSLVFQVLKPVQIELLIARQARAQKRLAPSGAAG